MRERVGFATRSRIDVGEPAVGLSNLAHSEYRFVIVVVVLAFLTS